MRDVADLPGLIYSIFESKCFLYDLSVQQIVRQYCECLVAHFLHGSIPATAGSKRFPNPGPEREITARFSRSWKGEGRAWDLCCVC